MIISHKYKFIFLKTNKTAGTSIEIALSAHCGADDIITSISPEDEITRRNLGYPGPQNHLSPIWERLLKGERRKKFYNHISAKEVNKHIGRQVWDDYYKFCFERNPWDRTLSLYWWRCRTGIRPTISEFVRSTAPQALKRKGFELYTVDGQIVVDKVCRFENLSDELEVIRKQLGIPEKLDLPRSKSRLRRNKKSYRDFLGEDEKMKIAELFRDEINLFGYEF